MMRNILITGVGGDIAQSIIKCLVTTKYKMNLIGCDIDPYAGGRKYVDTFEIAPEAKDTEKYGKFITSLVRKHKIQYIFPTTEIEIMFFDKKSEVFDSKGITIFINSSFIINTFFDKYKTVNFLTKIGVPCPKTFLINDYNRQLNYPLIIKPVRGSGSKQVIRVCDDDEFNFFKKRIKEAVVQEYLGEENEEYTTGVFSDGKMVYSITFKRRLGYGGLSKTIELTRDRGLAGIAEKIAHFSGLVGSLNIQSRKKSGEFRVFEINARFSSTVYFRSIFGFEDVKWWLCLKEKKKINYNLKYRRGIGVRVINEIFFDLIKHS